MKYDVFLVSAKADLEKASQIARRLRALKIKTRFDQTRDHNAASEKDLKDVASSRIVLVVWSKSALAPDAPDRAYMTTLAEAGRVRDGVLIQAAIDKAVPEPPFDKIPRQNVFGLAPRKIVPGFNTLAGRIGEKLGRPDLANWLALTPRQKDEKEAWKKAHRKDPLAAKPAAKTKPKAAVKSKPKPKPKAPTKTGTAAETAQNATAAPSIPTAKITSSSRLVRTKPAPLRLRPPVPPRPDNSGTQAGQILILGVSAGIFMLFLFGYLSKSKAASLPGVANAGPVLAEQCPPGQIPAGLLEPLAHGEIIDDTED